MSIDTTKWSGEGTFTQVVIDWLEQIPDVAEVRVEDAPASRSEADYNFISNEVFVRFATRDVQEPIRRFGVFPGTRAVPRKTMTMDDLERAMAAAEGIGVPDYSDAGMLQYLRTERIVPPYQTRGYKLVELVRIYEANAEARSDRH
jgi:hypothetical protein